MCVASLKQHLVTSLKQLLLPLPTAAMSRSIRFRRSRDQLAHHQAPSQRRRADVGYQGQEDQAGSGVVPPVAVGVSQGFPTQPLVPVYIRLHNTPVRCR